MMAGEVSRQPRCPRCNQFMPLWDSHSLCFKCRPKLCSQDDTCSDCESWGLGIWATCSDYLKTRIQDRVVRSPSMDSLSSDRSRKRKRSKSRSHGSHGSISPTPSQSSSRSRSREGSIGEPVSALRPAGVPSSSTSPQRGIERGKLVSAPSGPASVPSALTSPQSPWGSFPWASFWPGSVLVLPGQCPVNFPRVFTGQTSPLEILAGIRRHLRVHPRLPARVPKGLARLTLLPP